MKECLLRGLDSYSLPRPVYYQCVWIVRDRERLEQIKNEAKGTSLGRAASKRLRAIDKAIQVVPEEYRDTIISNVVNNGRFPDEAHENTWRKWKKRFLYELSKNLELI